MIVSKFKWLGAIALACSAVLAHATAPTPVTLTFTAPPTSSFYVYGEDGYGLASLVPIEATSGTLTTYGLSFASLALAPFDLLSLDLGNKGNGKAGGTIDLLYTVKGSLAVHQEQLKLDKHVGLQTFDSTVLGTLDNLTSFSLISDSLIPFQFQVDNIQVSAVQRAAAVPEPANLALFGAALALMGFMARRRAK